MSDELPVLWQYSFSNYNEKARWALDRKRFPHRRRTMMPGEPRAMAFALRGTVPVLDLDGRRIADSTAIVAELERRQPEPALYPSDPEQRRRALALEDYFDEELGHALRRALFWDLRDDREYMLEFIGRGHPPAKRALLRVSFPVAWLWVERRYAVTEADAELAWRTLADGLDRIERERDGGPYLVGDSFGIADLTAAALLWPLAWPEQFPYEVPELPSLPRFERLREHPAAAWIGETYARERDPSAAVG